LSRVIQHDLTGKLDGHSWTVEFPVYIDCTYLNARYEDHGVARHGYAVDAPFIETLRQTRYHHRKRFGIESSYRLSEQAIATTTRDATVRLLYVVVSPLSRIRGGISTTNTWQRLAAGGVASGAGHTGSSSI
jgi:IS4 transposase